MPLANSNQRFIFPPGCFWVYLFFFGLFSRIVFVRLQQQHPCFGAVCRLAKRWLGAQLLSDDVTEETADLLVASLFLHPAPFTPPRYSSPLFFLFFFPFLFSPPSPSLMFQICVYIPLFGSVGHVYEFLCLPQLSSGGLPAFPSSALLLWLEEQPTDR